MHVVFESGSTLQAWNQLETKDHPAFLHITWIWLHSLSLGLTEEEEAQVAGNNELVGEETSGEKRPREDHRPSPKKTQFLNTSTLHNQKPSVPEVKLHSPILEKSLKPGISGSAMPLCSNPHAHVERQEGNFPQAPDGKEHRD